MVKQLLQLRVREWYNAKCYRSNLAWAISMSTSFCAFMWAVVIAVGAALQMVIHIFLRALSTDGSFTSSESFDSSLVIALSPIVKVLMYPPVTGNPSKFNRCMLTQSKRYFDDKPQSTWYQSISLSHFIAKLRDGMSLQHISLSFSDNYLITNWLPWCPHNPQIRYKWNGFSSRRFGWWQWRLNTLSPHFHLIISTIIHSNTIHTSWLTKWISFI